MFKLVQYCPYYFKLVQTCSNLFNLSKLVHISLNLFKLVQPCPSLSKLVQTGPNLSNLVQTCSILSKTCSNLSKLVQTWKSQCWPVCLWQIWPIVTILNKCDQLWQLWPIMTIRTNLNYFEHFGKLWKSWTIWQYRLNVTILNNRDNSEQSWQFWTFVTIGPIKTSNTCDFIFLKIVINGEWTTCDKYEHFCLSQVWALLMTAWHKFWNRNNFKTNQNLFQIFQIPSL